MIIYLKNHLEELIANVMFSCLSMVIDHREQMITNLPDDGAYSTVKVGIVKMNTIKPCSGRLFFGKIL